MGYVRGQSALLGKYRCAGYSHKGPVECWLPVAQVASGNIKSCRNGCHLTKPIQSVIAQVVLRIRNGAKFRGIRWVIAKKDALNLLQQPCDYCGGQDVYQDMKRDNLVRGPRVVGYMDSHGSCEHFANYIPHRPEILLSGIDRLNSRKHYEYGNVVACCSRCNHAKKDMPPEQFRSHCRRIASHSPL